MKFLAPIKYWTFNSAQAQLCVAGRSPNIVSLWKIKDSDGQGQLYTDEQLQQLVRLKAFR